MVILNWTLPARTLADVVNTLTEPEIVFSVDGKPEASLENGTYTGTIKGLEASEFPAISTFDVSEGVTIEASIFKKKKKKKKEKKVVKKQKSTMIQKCFLWLLQ